MDDRRFHDVTNFHRSSVHILLADKDSQTRKEVFELLRRCSYKGKDLDLHIQVFCSLRSCILFSLQVKAVIYLLRGE